VQAHVITGSLHVSEVIEIYNSAIGQTYKIHDNTDYHLSNKRTKKNRLATESVSLCVRIRS